MIVRNRTPFVHALVGGRDLSGNDFLAVMLRGSFDITARGELRPAEQQDPVVTRDVHHDQRGRRNEASLRFDNELVPFKPRADIHVHAIAHAPERWPQPSWLVRATVGRLKHALRVTGPRYWHGGVLGDPEPCHSLPICYEHAYGGIWHGAGTSSAADDNPIGVGYLPPGVRPPSTRWPAPRIEAADDPIAAIDRRHRPQGFGPIARTWQPRRALAGTYDERWRRERWPDQLPEDFSFAHYQSAHPDMRYDGYLAGDEPVTLEGMDPGGPIRFALPGHGAIAVLRRHGGAIEARRAHLDTLIIDVPQRKATLIWRAAIPRHQSLRALEVLVGPAARARAA